MQIRAINGEMERVIKLESLKKNHQFQKIYRQGKAISAKKTKIYFKKNGAEQINLGVSISKKIGNSVERHRLKRIYKEAFRQKIKDDIKEGYDFIIVAKRGSAQLSYQEATEELRKLLTSKKIIK